MSGQNLLCQLASCCLPISRRAVCFADCQVSNCGLLINISLKRIKNIFCHAKKAIGNTGHSRAFCCSGVNECTLKSEVTLTLAAFGVLHYFYFYMLTWKASICWKSLLLRSGVYSWKPVRSATQLDKMSLVKRFDAEHIPHPVCPREPHSFLLAVTQHGQHSSLPFWDCQCYSLEKGCRQESFLLPTENYFPTSAIQKFLLQSSDPW